MCPLSWCATQTSSLSCPPLSNSLRTTQRASVRLKTDWKYVLHLWKFAAFSPCRQLDAGPETVEGLWRFCGLTVGQDPQSSCKINVLIKEEGCSGCIYVDVSCSDAGQMTKIYLLLSKCKNKTWPSLYFVPFTVIEPPEESVLTRNWARSVTTVFSEMCYVVYPHSPSVTDVSKGSLTWARWSTG